MRALIAELDKLVKVEDTTTANIAGVPHPLGMVRRTRKPKEKPCV